MVAAIVQHQSSSHAWVHIAILLFVLSAVTNLVTIFQPSSRAHAAATVLIALGLACMAYASYIV